MYRFGRSNSPNRDVRDTGNLGLLLRLMHIAFNRMIDDTERYVADNPHRGQTLDDKPSIANYDPDSEYSDHNNGDDEVSNADDTNGSGGEEYRQTVPEALKRSSSPSRPLVSIEG